MNPPAGRIHPWVFMILIIPFGVVQGYATVTLSYQLKQAGVSVERIASLVALSILPHTFKFFWAPIVDVTLNQKKWYFIALAPCVVGVASMGLFPPTAPGLTAISVAVFLSSLASSFLGMAVESLMAHGTPEELKGRAGGWFQAGALGGTGVGGGLGLILAEKLPSPWMASVVVGILCLLCGVGLWGAPTPRHAFASASLAQSLRATVNDIWQLARSRNGIAALVLCFIPLGASAAPMSAIAGEWQASAEIVALVTGTLGGIVSAAGCLLGGWLCDRMNRQTAYVWFGVVQAVAAVAMALCPRNPTMYILWALVYALTSGLAYAAFSAFVLEAIGQGAAASKYNALASMSNLPIYYMTNIDGWAHDRWSSSGMFFTEAALAALAAIAFTVFARILLRPRRSC
ncbi:MAG: MFS transporter [Verrucomicrobia bacterium]|nr:MFS transporter [Verrucomicrobiota bacterium]MBI3868007.1 MFS transporter [Verrucomicrobiota bacterium]